MRIHVVGPSEDATDQMRAYAEYRVFAALARYARLVRAVSVVVQPSKPSDCPAFTCIVDIDLGEHGLLACKAVERRPAEAIDQAAWQAQRAVERAAAARSPAVETP